LWTHSAAPFQEVVVLLCRYHANATLWRHVNAIQNERPGISFCKIFLSWWQNRIWDTSLLSDSSWFLSIVNWPRKLKEKGGHKQKQTTVSYLASESY